MHGLASTGFYWAPVVRELALLGHRALAVDLPGTGWTRRSGCRTKRRRTSRGSPLPTRRWRGSRCGTMWLT
ncbi:hypothetical protein [Nocardia neocaledoniensis]|uniref:hypothetical protein n=1 Tax=Nocardia neocaledoniensis TaxID=236511 RepID=UPI003CC7EA2C